MTNRLFLGSLFIYLLSAVTFGRAATGYEEISIDTQDGCKANILTQAQEAEFVKQAEYSWDGFCLDGFIEGPGRLQRISKLQNTTFTSEHQIRAHKGSAFGFAKISGESETMYRFQWNGQIIAYTGLGFEKDESLLKHLGQMPTRIKSPITFDASSSSIRKGYFTDGVLGLVVLTKTSCIIDRTKFADCPPDGYDVYRFGSISPISSKARAIDYCSNPRNLQSCGQSLPPLLETLVSQSELFIKNSMPAVMNMDREMQASIKPQLENLRREAEVQEKAKATDASAFQLKLDKAPVGELFAMADEFKAKGENAKARQTLRSLLSRFPDHKLVTPAASMLSELQGK